MASINDTLTKVGSPGSTTYLLSPGKAIAASSITLNSTTNWPTDTAVHFAIRQVDGSGDLVDGTYTEWKGLVSGSTITNLTLKSGSDQIYPAGAASQVYLAPNTARTNDMVDTLIAEHNQDGTHSDINADSLTVTGTSALGAVTADSLTISGSATAEGWSPLGDVPDTVTNNGNRSYDLVFNSNDLTDTVSNGMKLRLARTVSAPTTSFSLDGTNDYYVKSSPAGMTFTDDFAAGAWVYLTSYAESAAISRLSSTNGWWMGVDSSGKVILSGHNTALTNYRRIRTYQSIPLNKWVHISAQLDMNTWTNTTTTNYVMIDGANVPGELIQAGTNPTSLIQGGNLEVGSYTAAAFFPGYITEAFVTSAKLTQANVKLIMNQGITTADTSTYNMVSAFGNGSTTDLNTTNANNLTATNGATTANVAPWTNDDTGVPTGDTDFGTVTANSFSTNTTLTVEVPSGNTIPTSGGITTVDYSTQLVPYGHPSKNLVRQDNITGTVAFSAKMNQNIATGGQVTVSTYSDVFDTGSNFDPTTGIFTAPIKGVYCLTANSQYNDLSTAAGRSIIWIYINGVGETRSETPIDTTNNDIGVQTSLVAFLEVGDEVRVDVFQSGGATEGTGTLSNFSGHLVGRTD